MCAKCGDRFALLLANAKDLASVSAFSVFPRGDPESEAIEGIRGPEQLPFSPLMVLQRVARPVEPSKLAQCFCQQALLALLMIHWA